MAVLPDVLSHNLRIVFCGTAVGAASARRGAYYAGPGNAFWKTLFEIGLTPSLLDPERYRDVISLGLGFTDLAKNASGSDNVLKRSDFDREGLTKKILKFQPHIFAFTSKRAAEEYLGCPTAYGLLDDVVGNSKLFVLPSPSGLARRYWDRKHWDSLARLVSMPENVERTRDKIRR